jgi:CAAX protease family protein
LPRYASPRLLRIGGKCSCLRAKPAHIWGHLPFALPRLQSKWSALSASLLLSVFWAGWHLPIILSGQIPWPLLLSLIPQAILFTWVYNGTNGSLFMALVFHASFDVLGDFVYPLFSGPDLLRNYVLIAVVASVAALIVVIGTGPARLSRVSKQVMTPVAEAVAGV